MRRLPRYVINQETRKYKILLKAFEQELIQFINDYYYNENFLEVFKIWFDRRLQGLSILLNGTSKESSRRLINLSIEHVSETITTTPGVSLNDREIINKLNSTWSDSMDGIVSDVRKKVNGIINNAELEELRKNDVIQRVRNVFINKELKSADTKIGMRMSALTTMIIAGLAVTTYNSVKYERGKLSGEVKGVKWVTVRDERRCPICAALDVAMKMLGEKFSITFQGKTFETTHPPIHPNCRCHLEFIKIQKP